MWENKVYVPNLKEFRTLGDGDNKKMPLRFAAENANAEQANFNWNLVAISNL